MEEKLFVLSQTLGAKLKQNQRVLALAESCTGGGIAACITDIAGSSAYFDRGFVTYTNEAKMAMLDVSEAILEKHGAVSEACAKAMADGALARSLADITLSVTGVAGPGGGSLEKPVGTVWFALAKKNHKTQAHLCHFAGERCDIRSQAIEFALNWLGENV